MRKLDFSVDTLRSEGELSENETIIPIRLIDQAIRQEQPQFVNFLAQPKRAAVLDNLTNPTADTKALEKDFTTAVRYSNWLEPYISTVDGAALHGWDAVEIEYSPGRVGGTAITHIGNENLLFPIDCKKFTAADGFFIRKYIPASKLRSFVEDYDFNGENVEALLRGDPNCTEKTAKSNVEVFKFFFRKNGIVHLGWFSDKQEGWLKAPTPFYNGKQRRIVMGPSLPPVDGLPAAEPPEQWEDVPETTYNFVQIYTYRIDEQDEITSHTGRAAMDDASQEALTNLWTAAVNASIKASNAYASPKEPLSSAGGKPAVLDIPLIPDRIYDTPMTFWSHPGMDPSMIALANAVMTQHQATEGQVNFAAQNRKDSRKTATEIQASERSQGQLNSVSMLHFSAFVQRVLEYQWSIVKNLVQRDMIPFMLEHKQAITEFEFTLRPAGEVDVLERDELVQKILMLLPMTAMYPQLQFALMNMLITAMFAERAPILQQALGASNIQAQTNDGVKSFLGELLNMQNPDEMFDAVKSNEGMIAQTINRLTALSPQPQTP